MITTNVQKGMSAINKVFYTYVRACLNPFTFILIDIILSCSVSVHISAVLPVFRSERRFVSGCKKITKANIFYYTFVTMQYIKRCRMICDI